MLGRNGKGSAAVMEGPWWWEPTLSQLLSSLEEARHQPTPQVGSEEELGFLSSLLQSRQLHALVKVHNVIAQGGGSASPLPVLGGGGLGAPGDSKLHPVLSNSEEIAMEVAELLDSRLGIGVGVGGAGPTVSPPTQPAHLAQQLHDAWELQRLLQTPHMQGLLYAHDVIAQKDYFPKLPEVPIEVDEDEETVKIVQLVKSNEPLAGATGAEPIVGATIKTDERTGKIIIARIMHGGAADRSGLIHVGDEVCEVNGINVEGKTPNDVLGILQSSEGTITFKLIPSNGRAQLRESKVRVRTFFEYRSCEDPYIPCKEAGLDFSRGSVLHIVSQDDPYWWQARREGDRNMRAGLIPSRALQERRILLDRTREQEQDTETDDFDREEIPTYEEVAKLYPRPGMHRPLVLVGPPGVGRNELKRRLVASDQDRFRTTVPYTTRPQRPGEVEGKEYHFVSREKMEEEVEAGKFIEFGEYKGNLYGTSAESVMSLVNAGYVCVLNPHYQALKMLRTAELKPYVILVKPPEFERLKETRQGSYARSTFDESNSRGFTDEELHEMIRSCARIEYLYGHWCDEVLLNDDLSRAFEQLVRAVRRLEAEPLWVPASWVH